MNYRKFGRTGLHVSEICLNAESFGCVHDDAFSGDLLDAYWSEGGRFIQTVGQGTPIREDQPVRVCSEEIVGQWLRSRKVVRDNVVLATRIDFQRPLHGGGVSFANVIREGCEQSLRRLGSGHLDLLVCEWNERLIPVEDAAGAFDMLIRAGLVRHAVAAGFPLWRVSDALHRSRVRDQCRFDGLQAGYSLMAREHFESQELVMAREHRLGLIVRATLADGFLTDSQNRASVFPAFTGGWLVERFGRDHGDMVRAVLTEIAERRGLAPGQVALAWVLRDPQVTSALVSPASVSELRALVGALKLTLTHDEIADLNAILTKREARSETLRT